jgi:hypothetical protein
MSVFGLWDRNMEKVVQAGTWFGLCLRMLMKRL